MGTCVLPELCSRGGHLFLLTSSVCIITRLPGLGSRCYESARVTNDHGIALGTHTRTHTHRHNTHRQTLNPPFKSPKGMWGVCVYLLSSGLVLGVWPGFHWGGRTPSILLTTGRRYTAEAERNSAQSRGGSTSQPKKKHFKGCVQDSVELTGTCTQHSAKEKKKLRCR